MGVILVLRLALLSAPAAPLFVALAFLPSWAVFCLLPVLALAYLLGWIGLVGLLGRLATAPQPGTYDRRRDPAGWKRIQRQIAVADILQETGRLVGIEGFLASCPPLYRAYLRALGAKIGRATIARDIRIYLPSLLTVEDEACIGSGSVIAGLFDLSPGRLLIGRIRVGHGAFIGAQSHLAPDSRVGDRAVLGYNCVLGPSAAVAPGVICRGALRVAHGGYLGNDARLGWGVTVYGSAEIGSSCRLGDGASVGRNARLGHRVLVAAGASVGAGVRVEDGAKIGHGDEERGPPTPEAAAPEPPAST